MKEKTKKKFEQEIDESIRRNYVDDADLQKSAEFDDEPFDAAQGPETAIAKIKGKYGKKAIMKGEVKRDLKEVKMQEVWIATMKTKEREGFIFGGVLDLKI